MAMLQQDRSALIARVQANDAQLVSIEHAWFEKNDWGPSELVSLFHALHSNTHITKLVLFGQSALQSTEVMKQFVHMLSVNRSITTLVLDQCPVDGALLAQGLKQHPMLEELTLVRMKMSVQGMQAVFLALIECPALQSLCVRESGRASPAFSGLCTLLRCSRSLDRFTLSNCALSGAPLRQLTETLSTNQQLRTLILSTNGLNGRDDEDARCIAAMLSQNCTLDTLSLWDNSAIGESGGSALVQALQDNHTLTALITAHCNIRHSDERLIHTLSDRNRKEIALATRLRQSPTAVHATEDYTWFDRDEVRYRSQLSWLFNTLRTYVCAGTLTLDGQKVLQSSKVMQQFVDMLAANRSISKIELRNVSVDGSLLACGLKQHPMLVFLTLSDLQTTVDGMQAVLAALLDCPTIHSLSLNGNSGSVPSAMIELCTLLRRSRTLRSLDLTKCSLHGAPLRQLIEELSTNEQLQCLDLAYNELDDDDARCIADMLKKNGTLTQLNLSCNSAIAEAGWRALSDALRDNRTMEELMLSSCKLHGAPLRQLAEALSTNAQLHLLNLNYTELDADDARCLTAMLHKNHTLTWLDLSSNYLIGEAGGRALAEALRNNHTLCVLQTRSCEISNETQFAIESGLARNSRLARERAVAAAKEQAAQIPSGYPSAGSAAAPTVAPIAASPIAADMHAQFQALELVEQH
jgi:Ran GTPase-activating protein (RanGAP) involved in mRNA processing and transport